MCYSFFRCGMKRGGESVVLKSNMGRLPLAELMFNPNMLVGHFYRTPGSRTLESNLYLTISLPRLIVREPSTKNHLGIFPNGGSVYTYPGHSFICGCGFRAIQTIPLPNLPNIMVLVNFHGFGWISWIAENNKIESNVLLRSFQNCPRQIFQH